MQLPHDPTVAAIIPVYRATYLAECLASVRAQHLTPNEVIVIDDGSPDVDAIAGAVASWGGGLTVIRQENLGAGAARNRGIAATSADVVALLDADDAWHPQFLAAQVRRLRDTRATLVYANGRIIGESPLAGRLFMDDAPSSGAVTVTSLIGQQCNVLTSSVVVERQAIVAAGLFDETLGRGQDFDMWIRMAHHGARFAYTTTPLLDRRVHASNLSGDRATELGRALRVLEGLAGKLTLPPGERRVLQARCLALQSMLHFERGKQALLLGDDVTVVREEFREAARTGCDWRFQAAIAALRVSPRLVRSLYRWKLGHIAGDASGSLGGSRRGQRGLGRPSRDA